MSPRFSDAAKISLSIAIVYAISLSMAWDNPHWAVFSVAFCSLATVGESLLKGLLRTFGTFAAIFVAIALLALFPQDRWVFALCVSLWVAFCTWKMHANPNWYFWFCAGLGVPILSMLSGGESLTSFQTVVLRAQQTILGTLVFSFVASLLFPSNTRGAFEKDIRLQLADIKLALTDARAALLASGMTSDQLAESVASLKPSALRQAGLSAKLDAAALVSFDIAETKRAWRKTISALGGIVDTLERVRLGLRDLERANPMSNLTNLDASLDEILNRLKSADTLVSGSKADVTTGAVGVRFEASHANALPAFQRAALSQLSDKIMELDRNSQKLLAAVADARGVSKDTERTKPAKQRAILLPDPERIYGTLRVFTAFWLTYLAYVYIPDLPSWVVLISMTTAVSMLMMMAPTLPLRGLARPVVLSLFFAGTIHILVMPQLSGFLALGTVVLLSTFFICWYCHMPQQAMGRAMGLAFFAVLTQIENSQTYSFTFIANVTVAFGLVLSILVFVSYFPVSFQPQKVFLRLIRRYFSATVDLLETMHLDKRANASWLEQQRRAYFAQQMKIIPDRLNVWVKALPNSAITTDERKKLADLAAGMAMLTDRTRDLLATRETEHANVWVQEVVSEARAWRHAIQHVCSKLRDTQPEEIEFDDLYQRLALRMQSLEKLVAEVIADGRAEEVDAAQNDLLFKELGGFRGVSTSLISLVDQATDIDWARLREARL